jgi:predicted transcriptional regulator
MKNAAARKSDPATSHAAAAESMEAQASRIERIILGILRGATNGYTMRQVTFATKLPYETITPRFATLVRKGLIYRSGIRLNSTGRAAAVYFAR